MFFARRGFRYTAARYYEAGELVELTMKNRNDERIVETYLRELPAQREDLIPCPEEPERLFFSETARDAHVRREHSEPAPEVESPIAPPTPTEVSPPATQGHLAPIGDSIAQPAAPESEAPTEQTGMQESAATVPDVAAPPAEPTESTSSKTDGSLL